MKYLLFFLISFCFSQEKTKECEEKAPQSTRNQILKEFENNGCKNDTKEKKESKKDLEVLKKFIKS